MTKLKAIKRENNYLEYCKIKYKDTFPYVYEDEFDIEEVDSFYQNLNPETRYLEREEYQYLRYLLLNHVSLKSRKIMYLLYGFYDGICYSHVEVAKKLNVSTKSVLITNYRILKKLKSCLLEEVDNTKKSSK